MTTHFNPPTVDDVQQIANSFLSQGELNIQRLPTGLCHYVFDVQGKQQRFVIRICHPDNASHLNGNLFWSTQLQKLSLPIPQVFKLSIEEQKYSFMILEYIDGVDLGELVDQMSRDQKAKVVDRLIEFQKNADTLPEAAGFGWGFYYNCPQLLPSWNQIIENSLERARTWIQTVGQVDPTYVEKVHQLQDEFKGYFSTVPPRAFFHDLTTKNLLVSKSDYSVMGFVDLDQMAFGDPLFHISLMNMALLANNESQDLVAIWLDQLSATETQRIMVNFYTLIHCVSFMGENGMSFNKEGFFCQENHQKLDQIFQQLLSELKGVA
ncbi:MAG: phosphotransferase family protein [bacterium]